MINFWRLLNGMWAMAFRMQDSEDDGGGKARVQRFRRFLRIEKLKMLISLPVAYAAAWFLLIDPAPGYSLAELMALYQSLSALAMIFWFPFMLTMWALVLASAAFSVAFVFLAIGWVQVRFFDYSR